METLQEQLEQTEEKIKIIDNFITLSLKRDDISPDARNLLIESEKVSELMVEAHKCIQDKLGELNSRYDQVMRRMRQQQLTILEHVVTNWKKRNQAEAAEDKQIEAALANTACLKSGISTSAVKQGRRMTPMSTGKLMPYMAKLNISQNTLTPTISIKDYKNSPLTKRNMNPISLSFHDFHYNLTQAKFESIPKYMRGRETFDDLNSFLENVIIACFNEKYQLLYRHRNTIRNPHDLDLWRLYNEQSSYIAGRHFITPGDISRKINKMLDKKLQNRITMLRHIGVLQEQRVAQTCCYIWATNLQ